MDSQISCERFRVQLRTYSELNASDYRQHAGSNYSEIVNGNFTRVEKQPKEIFLGNELQCFFETQANQLLTFLSKVFMFPDGNLSKPPLSKVVIMLYMLPSLLSMSSDAPGCELTPCTFFISSWWYHSPSSSPLKHQNCLNFHLFTCALSLLQYIQGVFFISGPHYRLLWWLPRCRSLVLAMALPAKLSRRHKKHSKCGNRVGLWSLLEVPSSFQPQVFTAVFLHIDSSVSLAEGSSLCCNIQP